MSNFLKILLASIVGCISAAGLFFVTHVPEKPTYTQPDIQAIYDRAFERALAAQSESYGTTNVLPNGLSTYNVAGAGVSAVSSSITLSSLTLKQTGQKLVDSDFSRTFYVTLEPGNSARQEFAGCTTVTQNSDGTATLSGCSRGLSPISPYTASTTLRFAHAGGAQVVFSDPPQHFNEYLARTNDESGITGIFTWASTSPPRYAVVPAAHQSGAIASSSAEFASMAALNAVVAAGCIDADETLQGCVQLATGAQASAGTSAGTQARLVLPASLSTSTPSTVCTTQFCIVVARASGKISQLFLDLTEAFTWTGNHTFNGATTTIGSATTTFTGVNPIITIATTTPTIKNSGIVNSGILYNAGGVGVGTPTTTPGNLRVSGYAQFDTVASTTNFFVSGTCTNCATNGYSTVTNTAAGPTTIGGVASVTATCAGVQKVVGGGASNTGGSSNPSIQSSGPTGGNAWAVTYIGAGNGAANTMTAYAICVNP